MNKIYRDNLQGKIEARVLRTFGYNFNVSQQIGLLMLEENLFYNEATQRWEQATKKINQVVIHDNVSV